MIEFVLPTALNGDHALGPVKMRLFAFPAPAGSHSPGPSIGRCLGQFGQQRTEARQPASAHRKSGTMQRLQSVL